MADDLLVIRIQKFDFMVTVKPLRTLKDECLGRYNILQEGSKCSMERFEANWSD
jgi:hypothetical protein